MPHTVSTLSSALGAEVVGVDVSEIGDNLFGELRQVWLDHDGVMVIRDQHLTPEAYLDFGRRFGELLLPNLTQMPGYPEIYHYQVPVEEKAMPRDTVRNGSVWHAAHTCESRLSGASIVHVVELPPRGGDMFFANMYASYEALSEPMQRMLGELVALHRNPRLAAEAGESEGAAEHPIVYTHPESGRKALLVNPAFTTEILGLMPSESDALLRFLGEHCSRPEFIYRHHFRLNDLILWDDRCNTHYHISDYSGGGNVTLNRISAAGEPAP